MRHRARQTGSGDSNAPAALRLEDADVSLLDVIDHVLNQGIVLSGELTLGVADVDLIYLRLLALICSADRVADSSTSLGEPRSRQRRRSN